MLDAAVTPRIHIPQRDAAPASDLAPKPSGSRRWFVAATYSQAERRAAQNLAQQGYGVYLPLVRIRRRDNAIRSLWHSVAVPMFPAYCFVRFDPQHDPWRPINNTPGVFRLLTNAEGYPQPVARGAISALRAAEALAATQQLPGASWAPGVPCSLRRGYAMEGLPAVVLSTGRGMALIAVMFLGQLREVTVELECLRARDE